MPRLTLRQAADLSAAALAASRIAPDTAAKVAAALVVAEADGLSSHGLARLPIYARQAEVGKVDGFARPRLEHTASAAMRIDAGHGFAFPAIDLAIQEGCRVALEAGTAAAAIHRSHHAGVLGHHVEAAADRGLVALAFANTPAGIAPWGGRDAVFGTNPIAFAAPRRAAPPLVIDLSLSKVARGKIMLAQQKGEAIPEGWALDAQGRPTTDAEAALAGTMLPMGDAKGAALALMVEVLAAALGGANFAFEASSVLDDRGNPPGIGQSFLFLSPQRLGGDAFGDRLEILLSAILNQPGARLPGQRRLAARARAETEGIEISADLLTHIERRAGRSFEGESP
ncbi:Ldh family oxidoreductase [Telmatospirillum siberiense]|uniref:Sulfolactate dehydrogenase n=1 Tax=Telmatospirillum siberiense TaxID=382514 RepID=A0A2N3PXP1_9PROT|nr:Ldh family oxidoreductase [Telmatospirillum siberiense]PKU25180.1 sulfolactate dehydrogenase [Telmatospirillum siberiense]